MITHHRLKAGAGVLLLVKKNLSQPASPEGCLRREYEFHCGNKENCPIMTHANEFGNILTNFIGTNHLKARVNDNVGAFSLCPLLVLRTKRRPGAIKSVGQRQNKQLVYSKILRPNQFNLELKLFSPLPESSRYLIWSLIFSRIWCS